MGAIPQSWWRSGHTARRSRASMEALSLVDDQSVWRRLDEAYAGHAIAGILPAKRRYELQRTLDLMLGIPALLLTLPFYPLIIWLVQRESPGPGLYRQIRVGKDGRPFVAYKFRTMRHIPPEQARAAHLEVVTKWMAGAPMQSLSLSPGDTAIPGQPDRTRQTSSAGRLALTSAKAAEPRSHSQYKQRFQATSFKYTDDPRITRAGRILRKLSLDELPQLINIVRGEMSLVGPRPSTPYEVERYSERALARLRVLPGLTGKWQVEGRGRVGFDEMVEMDLHYVVNGSLWRDVALILRTIPAVVRCNGAG